MLKEIDVIMLVHYMIFTSTDNEFAINFQKIDSVSLCELFAEDFHIDISYFRDLDLDNDLLNNLAAFMFIHKYRSCFSFMYPEGFSRICKQEQRRVYLKMFST